MRAMRPRETRPPGEATRSPVSTVSTSASVMPPTPVSPPAHGRLASAPTPAPLPGAGAATGARPGRDPDPDGLALLLATVLGVGAALAASTVAPAWWVLAATACAIALAGLLLLGVRPAVRPAVRPGTGRSGHRLGVVVPAARLVGPGCLALAAVAVAAMAVTGARLALLRAAVLPGLEGEAVTVRGTVGGEPRQTRYGGRLVGLTVSRVEHGRGAWRTRERATVILPAGAGPVSLGDQLTLAGTVRPAMRTDPLGWRPAVDLRQPAVLARSPSRSVPLRLTGIVRSRARDQALASLPPEPAGLLAGMALGDTSILRGDVEAAFNAAGLTHLTAVSGANLALALGVALGLALLLGAGRPTLGVVGMLVIPGFVLLTRWEPSVLRAAVMAVIVLLGVATGRGPGGRRALCLAVTILVLADPALAFSLGFLLSVTATAGILWLAPPLVRALPPRLPEVARVAAASTLAAQAAALPVAALATGTLPLAGLPANLLAIPLAAAPMLLGLLNAVLAIPAGWAADLACLAAAPFLAALIQVARWAQALGEPVALPAGPARLLVLAIPAVFAVACHRAAGKRAAGKRAFATQRRARSP